MAKYIITSIPQYRKGGAKKKEKSGKLKEFLSGPSVPFDMYNADFFDNLQNGRNKNAVPAITSNWDSPVEGFTPNNAWSSVTGNGMSVEQPNQYTIDPMQSDVPSAERTEDQIINTLPSYFPWGYQRQSDNTLVPAEAGTPDIYQKDIYGNVKPIAEFAKVIPNEFTPVNMQGEKLTCPEGKKPYKGQCLSEEAIARLEGEKEALYARIAEDEKRKQEEELKRQQEEFINNYSTYIDNAIAKGNKHKKGVLDPFLSYSKEDWEGYDMEKLYNDPSTGYQSDFYMEKQDLGDGNYKVNFYPRNAIHGMIHSWGMRPGEFEKYHGLDSKKIAKEFKNEINYADQVYEYQGAQMLDECIKQGYSAEECEQRMVKKNYATSKGATQKFGDIAESMDFQYNADKYFIDDSGVMYKEDPDGNVYKYTSDWKNDDFTVFDPSTTNKNDSPFTGNTGGNFNWEQVDKSKVKKGTQGQLSVNGRNATLFDYDLGRSKDKDESTILAKYKDEVNKAYVSQEEANAVAQSQGAYASYNQAMYDHVYGNTWTGDMQPILTTDLLNGANVSTYYADAYNDAVKKLNAVTKGVDVSQNPDYYREKKAKIVADFNKKVSSFSTKVYKPDGSGAYKSKINPAQIGFDKGMAFNNYRDVNAFKTKEGMAAQRKLVTEDEALNYLQYAYNNDINPSLKNVVDDSYRGEGTFNNGEHGLKDKYGSFQNFLYSDDGQRFMQEYRNQPTFAQALVDETTNFKYNNLAKDEWKKQVDRAKEAQKNLDLPWYIDVLDQGLSLANQPLNTVGKWWEGKMQDPFVGLMTDSPTTDDLNSWNNWYGPGGTQLYMDKINEMNSSLPGQAMNLFSPFHWAAQTGNTAHSYFNGDKEQELSDVALNALFAFSGSKLVQGLSGAKVLPGLRYLPSALKTSKYVAPAYNATRNLLTPGNALNAYFAKHAFIGDGENPGFAVDAAKNIYEGYKNDNLGQALNENLLNLGMGVMIGNHSRKIGNQFGRDLLTPQFNFNVNPSGFNQQYYPPRTGIGSTPLRKEGGTVLPKAARGRTVKPLKVVKDIGRAANIATLGTANSILKKVAPWQINPVHVPTFGMLAGERSMIGPFTGSPLNVLPFYGKDLRKEMGPDEAFRYFGDNLDYVKLNNNMLDSAHGPLLRMGKNTIMRDTGQWFEQGTPNASYTSVFGVRANPDAPGSNLQYMPKGNRNGVLIGDVSNSNPRVINLNDPGATTYRRLPLSNKLSPVDLNNPWDWKNYGGNLQALVERYGYGAAWAAGLTALGAGAGSDDPYYTQAEQERDAQKTGPQTPQDYFDQYVNKPIEDYLYNPWIQPAVNYLTDPETWGGNYVVETRVNPQGQTLWSVDSRGDTLWPKNNPQHIRYSKGGLVKARYGLPVKEKEVVKTEPVKVETGVPISGVTNAFSLGNAPAIVNTDFTSLITPKINPLAGYTERRQIVQSLKDLGYVGRDMTGMDMLKAAKSDEALNTLMQLAIGHDRTGYRQVTGDYRPQGSLLGGYGGGRTYDMTQQAYGAPRSEYANMMLNGVNIGDRLSLAKYQAQSIPMQQYGYRAGLPDWSDMDGLYLASLPEKKIYGNHQFKISLPTDFTKGDWRTWYNDYILNKPIIWKPNAQGYDALNLDLDPSVLYFNQGASKGNQRSIHNSDLLIPNGNGLATRQWVTGKGTMVGNIDPEFKFTDLSKMTLEDYLEMEDYRNSIINQYNTGWRGHYKQGGDLPPSQPNLSPPHSGSDGVYRKVGNHWEVDWNRSGHFQPLTKGNVKEREAKLNNNAKPLYDKDYYDMMSFQWQSAPKTKTISKPTTQKEQVAQQVFNNLFEVKEQKDMHPFDVSNTMELHDKALDFHKGWMTSPMYMKMLNNSINAGKALGIDESQMDKQRIKNFNTIPFVTFEKQPEDDSSTGGVSMSDNGLIRIFPQGAGVSDLSAHEVSHSVDRPVNYWKSDRRLIPQADINYIQNITPAFNNTPMWKNYEPDWQKQILNDPEYLQQEKDWVNYVGAPTEVRARLNAIRATAKESGTYDPYTEEVTPDIYNMLQKMSFGAPDKGGFNPIEQLKGIYTDEQIIEMLNTISQNDNSAGDQLNMAKFGGELPKARYGLPVRTAPEISRSLKPESEFRKTMFDLQNYGELPGAAPTFRTMVKPVTRPVPIIDQGVKNLLMPSRIDMQTGESNFSVPEISQQLGDFDFKDFSDGWVARQAMMNMASTPQWAIGKNDFYKTFELTPKLEQALRYNMARWSFDEMYPENMAESLMDSLTGNNKREEMFANLFPDVSLPNFRDKFLTLEQEKQLQEYLHDVPSVYDRGMLNTRTLKSLTKGEDTLPRTYKDLLNESKADSWLRTADPKLVVMEMRGGLGLKIEDINNATPEQLEKWRQEIVRKMYTQVKNRWERDISVPMSGFDAFQEFFNRAGSRNKFGGAIDKKKKGGVAAKLTQAQINKYIADGYIVEEE